MLSDQSKILPTLTKNARSNAQDLEYRRPPAPPGCREAGIPPPADATNSPKTASTASRDRGSSATAAFLPSAGPSSTSSGEKGGCDTAHGASTARRRNGDGGQAGDDGAGTDAEGRWLATELLFSDSEEDILRWRGSCGGRRGTVSGGAEVDRGSAVEGDLFDLVVAADVVYLNDLWDAMAFTIKVRVVYCGTHERGTKNVRSPVRIFLSRPGKKQGAKT